MRGRLKKWNRAQIRELQKRVSRSYTDFHEIFNQYGNINYITVSRWMRLEYKKSTRNLKILDKIEALI